jgi:hypothetical protein
MAGRVVCPPGLSLDGHRALARQIHHLREAAVRLRATITAGFTAKAPVYQTATRLLTDLGHLETALTAEALHAYADTVPRHEIQGLYGDGAGR